MQNTITLERTLQYVEAGQVLTLKRRICGVVQNNTNSDVFLTFSFRIHLGGTRSKRNRGKKKKGFL